MDVRKYFPAMDHAILFSDHPEIELAVNYGLTARRLAKALRLIE
jgi:hypothetical protein